MKRIAYIELDTHAEIAANFLELMEDSREFEVDYFFSPKIYTMVGKSSSNIVEVSPAHVLQNLEQGNYNLVIIGTAHRYFNLFLNIASKFNTSIIVHNQNFVSISKFDLLKKIFKKDIQYRIKLLLKEDLLSAPDVFKKAKNLLVLDENLTDKKSIFLPVLFNKFQEKQVSEVCTVVIPGAVSQKRRDYLHVLKTLRKFRTDSQFKIVFLGKASGHELSWLAEFDQNKPANISIEYFTEKVPQETFDEWMNKADVLWCPVQSETEFFSQKEIYGKTKMSGNIGDSIKYGKTAIFPPEFSSQHSFLVAENLDIEAQLLEIKENAPMNFQEKFSKENVRAELEKRLRNFL